MSDDLTTSISLLSEAATRAENTTTFFDDVTTGGTDETVTNPNNSVTVPTVQKQIYDLYTEDGTTIAAQDAQEAAEAAQEAAEAAQAAAEAAEASTVEISGLDTVYDAIGLVSPANIQWDVEIPFNDSLNIARGYGTYDQIDVSADQDESIMVDLTTKSVDYSRASTTGSINKSGEFETLDEDEPMICSDGLGVFGSYENLMIGGSTSSNGWSESGVSVSDTTIDDLDFVAITEDTSTSDHKSIYSSNISVTSGYYTLQYLVSKDSDKNVRLRIGTSSEGLLGASILDIDTGEVTLGSGEDSGAVDYGDYYLFYITAEVGTDSSTSNTGIWMGDGTSYEGDGVSSVYVTHRQFTNSSTYLPYIETETTTATRSADIATIQMENNFPAAGEDFTFIVDCEFPDDEEYRVAFSDGPQSVFLRRQSTGTSYSTRIVFFLEDGSDDINRYAALPASDDYNGLHRFVGKYESGVISLYCDGTLGGYNTMTNTPTYSIDSNIYIGSRSGSSRFLNNYIKGFKIVHEALSDSQIAALGSAS